MILGGTLVEPGPGGLDVADAAADPAGEPGNEPIDQGGVRARAHGGVQVDHGDLAGEREAFGDRHRIAGVDRLGVTADELDRLPALQVDGWNDHGRTFRPCSIR